MAIALQQPISSIEQLAVNDSGFGRQLVRLDRAGGIDVQDLMSVRNEPVGDEHPVAAEVNMFGTHVGRGRCFRQPDNFCDRILKLSREHVVRVIPKTVIAQGEVWRVVEDCLAMASECLHPYIAYSGGGQRLFQRVTVELRKATRHWKCTDVDQRLDVVGLQSRD